MVKRRKTRTHALRPDPTLVARGGADAIPKSFVVKAGRVGSSVSALVADMRRLLEPNTASRLRERKRNRLRDFVAMSGPLGVSHLLVFSQASTSTDAALSNVNLRLSRMPRGPTLTFKVLRYALSRDILSASKHPHSPGKEFATEPLLILNNFGGQEKQLKLMTTVFQNLFPAIHVQSMPLTAARRVVLLSYNSETRTIDLRHYLISVRPVGISKSIRKIIEGSSHSRASSTGALPKGIPDLSGAGDFAEYVLHHAELGYASSASEAESDVEGVSKRVELSGKYVGRGNRKVTQGEQRAIKLVELGPRMELGLVKIDEALGGSEGEVMFHELISKTPKEVATLAKKRQERVQRRKTQEARVKAKAAAAASTASKGKEKETDDDVEMSDEAIEEVPQNDDFDYEDLFDEGADSDAAGDILDEVLEEEEEAEAVATPAANPRRAGRDPTRKKFTLKR